MWRFERKIKDILQTRPVRINNPNSSHTSHPANFFVITNRGVFIWGKVSRPHLIELPIRTGAQRQILDVSVTSRQIGLLLGDGKPYFRDLSSHGSFSCPSFFLHNPICVVSLCCRQDHTAVITDIGTLFLWGKNDYHQVCLEVVEEVSEPTEINLGCAFRKVQCGSQFTYALNEYGEWLVWGNNEHHQISPTQVPFLQHPTTHEFLSTLQLQGKLREFQCGLSQCIAVSDLHIYAWGMNAGGSLGLGHNKVVATPEIIRVHPEIVAQIFIGTTITAILKRNGAVMVAGEWFSYVEGDPEKFKFSHLKGTRDQPFVSVACVLNSVAVLTEHGDFKIFDGTGEVAFDHKFHVDSLFGLRKCELTAPWKVQRLFWIAHMKNTPEECSLAQLPKPLIQYIISLTPSSNRTTHLLSVPL